MVLLTQCDVIIEDGVKVTSEPMEHCCFLEVKGHCQIALIIDWVICVQFQNS